MTHPSTSLRQRAEAQASRLPPLLARAERLAGSVLLGEHGRRQAGLGDDFWQYRPAQPGDSGRLIDHRRSARGDVQYVREREWQIAQSVMMWVDQGASMRFSSASDRAEKIDRARLLALALAIVLIRNGERVGLTGTTLPPRRGNAQILRLAEHFAINDDTDYAPPDHRAMIPHARAVFLSDFLGDIQEIRLALTKAADRGVHGILLQVLDPDEERFPYRGRTVFHSVGGGLRHETLMADGLRDRYLARLAERRDALAQLCRDTGWHLGTHHTGKSTQSALLWLHQTLGGRAR